jgi:transposase
VEKGGLASELKEAGVTEAVTLFWADEMRVGLLGQVRRVWAPRGVKVRQEVELKYEWVYLNLAVDGLAGTLHWEWTPNMKQDTIAEVVETLKEKGVRTIVWDGAPGHRGQKVREIGVTLIRLPPYSPELNPAERVFEELRRHVEGQVYGSIEKKMEAVECELLRLAADPERVRSLAGWNWIREAVTQAQETESLTPLLLPGPLFSERYVLPTEYTVFQ